ncbi:MAG: glycosyltransferase family A protein [Conexivisphaerales archaeon]
MKPRILAIVTTLNEMPSTTLQSIMTQTIEVSKTFIVVGTYKLYQALLDLSSDKVSVLFQRADMTKPLGIRLARAINYALQQVDLKEYDFVLKVDADIVLPNRFLEENCKLKAAYIGRAGSAMLIRVKPFLQVFGGRFAEVVAEDSYIGLMFLYKGFTIKNYACKPVLMPESRKHHSFRYYYALGKEYYKLGYEPIHVIASLRYGKMELFKAFGYFVALLNGTERYEFARFVAKLQTMRLLYGREKILRVYRYY